MFAERRDSGRKKSEVLGEANQSDEHVEEGNQGADVSQLQVELVRLTWERRFRLLVRVQSHTKGEKNTFAKRII